MNKLYKLVWIVNGVVKETLVIGSASLCSYKKEQVKSNYTTGLLQVRSENGIKYNINYKTK
jgi:hypothetical protein